jgi:flavin reductase (DIM6/NTAB) family NADH-FMN oxidoreductase RutF
MLRHFPRMKGTSPVLSERLQPYLYTWPLSDLGSDRRWSRLDGGLVRNLPEDLEELAKDSRWPSFFPSPTCFVTTGNGRVSALEKVVGPSIVNRFPYVVALSFCREDLSPRHYARREFCRILEETGAAAVQFLMPGTDVDSAMSAITSVPDSSTTLRIARSDLAVRPALTSDTPVFSSAYLVYEASLATPMTDHLGIRIYDKPWVDVGSHRIYFLEINAILLRDDIARGHRQIRWTSLPGFHPTDSPYPHAQPISVQPAPPGRYQKGYNPKYAFPSAGTIAFQADDHAHGMAVKYLSREDPWILDDDQARWPCFFPQSAAMITSRHGDRMNVMPCGSTTIVSRDPLVVAPCVSYAQINQRYAPRASLELIRASGRFGAGVPFRNDRVVNAIKYAGNTSLAHDSEKLWRMGLSVDEWRGLPYLPQLPVYFDCRVTNEIRLGTHIMFLGTVEAIRVRSDLTSENPLTWCTWADVELASERWPATGRMPASL